MEVDPSLSQFKHPINDQNHAYNDRPQQGNVQKPFANSGRYTVVQDANLAGKNSIFLCFNVHIICLVIIR